MTTLYAGGGNAYAGTVVRRGEASGEVTATGSRTNFGKTAELVRTAQTAGHLQETIFAIVKYLILMDAGLVAAVLAYGFVAGIAWGEKLPFSLMLLVASVPVALPATFTLASALGTQELAHQGVLVSRLSAIEEAAAMDVLASDKLMFVMLVFSGQGNVYLVRERGHFWNSRPGKWLLASSLSDFAIVSLLAIGGILMAPVKLEWVAILLGLVLAYLFAVDFLKIRIFRYFDLH